MLPVLYADKNYQDIDDIIWAGTNLVKTVFTPTYPDANRWSTAHHVKIEIVDPNDQLDPNIGLLPCTVAIAQQTHVFNANLQKELLLEFKQKSKIKSQEYATRRLSLL